MNTMEFLISVIQAEGGTLQGRTLLQKLCFFTERITGLNANLGYDAHFYGPYSATVESTVARMKSIGFLQEDDILYGFSPSGFEKKRYDYTLTAEGKSVASRLESTPDYLRIKAAVDKINSLGAVNYVELSFAAKVYFILTKENSIMTKEGIRLQASQYNWNIPEASTGKAIDFLLGLGLASTP